MLKIAERSAQPATEPIDWSECLSVELHPGGSVVIGSDISPDLLVEQYTIHGDIEELSQRFHLPFVNVSDVLAYDARVRREREDPPAVRIDWGGCDAVERVLGRMGGIPVVKDSRVQADSIVENFISGSSVDEIILNFGLEREAIETILAFALRSTLDLAS